MVGVFLVVTHTPTQNSETQTPAYTGFTNPQPVTIQGYTGTAMEPFISRDGEYLFFNDSNDPATNTNLYYAKKVNDTTFVFQGEVGGVNTASLEGVASMDRAGAFYFVTTKSYTDNLMTLYHGVFRNGTVSDSAPVQGVARKQAGWLNMDAEISPDGNALYYAENLFKGGNAPTVSTIAMATKNPDGSFTKVQNSDDLFRNINNSGLNYAPSTSSDGLTLFFTRANSSGAHIYIATRASTSEPFGAPRVVAGADGFVEGPSLSSNGTYLYYHKQVKGSYKIYVLTRSK